MHYALQQHPDGRTDAERFFDHSGEVGEGLRGGEGNAALRKAGQFREKCVLDARRAGEVVEDSAEGGGGCVGASEAERRVR